MRLRHQYSIRRNEQRHVKEHHWRSIPSIHFRWLRLLSASGGPTLFGYLGWIEGFAPAYVKIDPTLYSQILLDERISNGAFRLWHLLLGMTGKNPCCWPSVTTIAKKLHTNRNSVMKWITELEAALYLRVERGHQHKSNRYFVGGTKTELGSTKSSPIGGTKSVHELNPTIQSISVNPASERGIDLDKPESISSPEVAAQFFRQMRESLPP